MCNCTKHNGLNGLDLLSDYVNYNGMLLHPDDARLPKVKAPLTPRPPMEVQVLTAEDLERVRAVNIRSAEFMANGGPTDFRIVPGSLKREVGISNNESSNIKTYGLAALVFGAIVFVAKKMKGKSGLGSPKIVNV